MIKERGIIRVSTVNVSGDAATADFTSDAVRVDKFRGITLSFWVDSLTETGQTPNVTIQASNSTDVDSFETIDGANKINIPVAVQNLTVQFDYVRFIYASKSATGGTVAYELRKI